MPRPIHRHIRVVMTPHEAILLMKAAHAGQVDKSGKPYWTHPMRVAKSLGHSPDYVIVAALLHDVLEDTPITVGELISAGVDSRSLEILHIVTRRADEAYHQFISRIADSRNFWALRVKLADNTDNLGRNLPPEAAHLRQRYINARKVLLEALQTLASTPDESGDTGGDRR